MKKRMKPLSAMPPNGKLKLIANCKNKKCGILSDKIIKGYCTNCYQNKKAKEKKKKRMILF